MNKPFKLLEEGQLMTVNNRVAG